MISLSVVIITFNEEHNITRCINSVLAVADDIVVVDSFSTDATPELCRGYFHVRFFQNNFVGHVEQKNYALGLAKYSLVLSLDADEVLSPQLQDSILKVKSSDNLSADGYYFPRLTNYAGHWVRYCGWYPDKKLRLFDRHKGKWGGANPHDIVKMNKNTRTAQLTGDLWHYSYGSISEHVAQTNKFTTIAARSHFQLGVRSNLFKVITRPILKFLRDYFWKRGVMDGSFGLIICTINALSAFLKYAKIRELQKGRIP